MTGFKASARAVDMLGRQQIAGIPSAISELFKNAHDAYASVAVADFLRQEAVFVLRDDGDGMTRKEFESRWLTLGTSSKAAPEGDSPDRGRAVLGEKGIGRLAIAAIGPQTLVLTKSRKGGEATAALIHWGVFELMHASLDDVVIPVTSWSSHHLPEIDQMARHVLANLRALATPADIDLLGRIESDLARWSEVDLVVLARATGFDMSSFEGGTVFVITPTSPDLQADLEAQGVREAAPLLRTLIGFANTMTPNHRKPELSTVFRDHRSRDDVRDLISDQEFFTVDEFQSADHHFFGTFDEYGQFTGSVSIFGNEPQDFSLAWPGARGRRTQCGPFQLNLAYIQGRARQSNLAPDDYLIMLEKLDHYGGLYIYRDGVRVLPYGDSRFDWLDVELRRTKSASDNFFSYRRMFGAVEISRDGNSKLREKAGREGFATNEAYRQFRSILENFLIQVAAEFFREGAPQGEQFEQGRIANERMEAARKTRSRLVRTRRSSYSDQLTAFFESLDSDLPRAKVEEVIKDLEVAVLSMGRSVDASAAADSLARAELAARSRLRQLSDDLTVKRPRGVGLTGDLERRSATYEAARADVLKTIIEPAFAVVEMRLAESTHELNPVIHRRLRFDQAVEAAASDARSRISSVRRDLQQASKELERDAHEVSREVYRAVESTVAQVLATAASTDVAHLTNEDFSTLRWSLEREARESANSRAEAVSGFVDQIRAINWELTDSPDGKSLLDQMQALESRLEAMEDRASQDFELVQLGLAVNVVTHEFENSIRAVRDNLRRLREWARSNSSLRPLYSDLRASFDHLDGYLRLFTPLHRRLYRSPVTVHGADVVRYLHDVFDERLTASAVELSFSSRFENSQINAYPSTLYAVLVNLIDNAIHWLANFAGKREISVDAGQGIISVTDSGHGVSHGDHDAIFEQGFSRKPGGSGYGLFVAREVLRREGGDLWLAEIQADRGARFEFSLDQARG